jgi:hypothetical protein
VHPFGTLRVVGRRPRLRPDNNRIDKTYPGDAVSKRLRVDDLPLAMSAIEPNGTEREFGRASGRHMVLLWGGLLHPPLLHLDRDDEGEATEKIRHIRDIICNVAHFFREARFHVIFLFNFQEYFLCAFKRAHKVRECSWG